MRSARGVLRPANFARQFGRSKETKTLNACLYPVLVKTSEAVPWSNIQWRGRSFTASLPSNSPEVKKGRTRISKDERKSMVEKYVNEYRTMNGGKFPTVNDAKKSVGGCYYVVRKILQELKFNSKMSSVDITDATSVEQRMMKNIEISIDLHKISQTTEPGEVINHGKPFVDVLDSSGESRLKADVCEDDENSFDTLLAKKAAEESQLLSVIVDSLNRRTKAVAINHGDEKNEIILKKDVDKEKSLTEAEEVLSKFTNVDEPISKLQVDDSNAKDLDSKGGPPSFVSSESGNSKTIGTQFRYLDEETKSSGGTDRKEQKQQTIESKFPGDVHKVHAEEANPERKSSVWQNLKSFANEILGMWRRS